MTKQINLEIDISEFFELNRFRCEDNEFDILKLDSKFRKLIMSGEIAEDMIGFCKHGGINITYSIFFLINFFIRND